RRILKPGGHFICVHFPNRYGWVEPLGRLVGSGGYFHPRRYDLRDISELVRTAGMQLIEHARYNFFPRNQMARLPKWLCERRQGVALLDGLDSILTAILPWFAQNHCFVARKPLAN